MWWWGNQAEHPETKIYGNRGKSFNVDMHSDVYESIWFKRGMVIGTIVLLIQGLRSARK